MPLLKIYDSLAQYWSRSNPHRPSTAAAYLPIWHADVRSLIACRTTRASDKYRFTHIFPALWVPDLLYVSHVFLASRYLLLTLLHPAYVFYPILRLSLLLSMKRLELGLSWSFFDPSQVPGLADLTGEAFEQAYEDFEGQGLAISTSSASHLWGVICDAQRESGAPFISYADNINSASPSR